MGGRLSQWVWVAMLGVWGCDDGAQPAPGCTALGVPLAIGDEVLDEAACVVCVCDAPDAPACTPWPGCPDRGRPPPAVDAAPPDQAPPPDAAPDTGAPDLGPDAQAVPSEDPDGDGQPTDVERVAGTDPLDPDSFSPRFMRVASGGQGRIDTTLTPQLRAVDVAFVVDTTGSMQPVIDGLVAQLAEVAQALAAQIPDARYGLGVFRDYASVAGVGNFPFQLKVPLSADVDQTIRALARVRSGAGGGGRQESAYEALQQALTGTGYDENCDGFYTPTNDVLPFATHPGDAFSGNVVGAVTGDAGRLGKGGVGFAPGALPLVVLATDAPPRQPATEPSPGGCPFDATEATVVAAADALGAKVITLYTQSEGGAVPPQFPALAAATGSTLPGPDGEPEPLVFALPDPANLRAEVLQAVTGLLGATRFEAAAVRGEARPPAMIVRPMPADWGPIAFEDYGVPRPVSVILDATDGGRRIVSLELTLTAGAGVVLDRQQWWVLVE